MSELTTLRDVHKDGRWTIGGDGAHWNGCEETHWDCMIVHQAKQITALQARIDELEGKLDDIREKVSDIRDLARTGSIPTALGMTELEWNVRKVNKMSAELTDILDALPTPEDK